MQSETKFFRRQCIAGVACFFDSIGCGVVMSFTGTLFPQLEQDPSFHINKSDESWIASTAILSMAFGCILGGLVLPHLARNFLIMTTNLLMITGFLFIYFSTDVTTLIVGRTLSGLALGMSRPVIVTIVGEVATPNLRPFYTNTIMLGHIVGGLLSDTLATFTGWNFNSLFTCLYPVLAIFTFLYLREPYGSHIARNDIIKAAESFEWYRGIGEKQTQELNQILSSRQSEGAQHDGNFNLQDLNKTFFKAFGICSLFFAAGQLNGFNVLSLYSVEIFQKMFPDVNGNYVTIGYDVVKIVASLNAGVVIQRFRVRTLTFGSAVGVILTLLTLSLLYYLENDLGNTSAAYNYVTAIVLILYVQFLLCGLATLPWGAPAELFNAKTRSIGSGATIFMNYVNYFLLVKFTPSLLDVSYSLTFLIFAISTLFFAVVLYFVLPETKNKTLNDAQATINTNT